MKLHCSILSTLICPFYFVGKRHKGVQVVLVSSTSRTGPLIVCQSLSQRVYVGLHVTERDRERAVQLNLESYRCSHQPHAMQQRFLPKAKGAEASDNRCERGSHNCRFSKCLH